MNMLETGPDGLCRCGWCMPDAPEFYRRYHDEEWGFPVGCDTRLFEKICLEGFQSGLSWRTILAKRKNFRAAFAGFDIDTVARFDTHDVERLVQDAGIIRHRGKIEAAINNAGRALEMRAEFGSLAAFFWSYEPREEELMELMVAPSSPVSVRLSKDLRKRGWKFVGPTTAYAFMQAMGLINDHAQGCITREAVARARAEFVRPSRVA
ncbi:DNA-3-methyladenine glycosylase I [Thioclava sp. GXIMD2076]|uniref:DNA-3-methyladenine glycosylase I n=1 Tax=Thioclava sp. GXIMD2076 TaxID=3131931 RepID=UPI0030CDC360